MTLTGVTACTARRDFWATVYNGSPYATCLSCPVCNVCVLWPNGWIDQDATWCEGKPLSVSHCVRWGRISPTERGTASPPLSRFTGAGSINHSPRLLWPNGGRSQRLLSSCSALWPSKSITNVDTASVNMRSMHLSSLLYITVSPKRYNDAWRLTGDSACRSHGVFTLMYGQSAIT